MKLLKFETRSISLPRRESCSTHSTASELNREVDLGLSIRSCLWTPVIWLTIFTSLSQAADPIVIAHRGASGYLPEHTLEAKALAHAMGADFIEQDVVLSKDDVPMVLHDIYLDTVSDVAAKFPARKREDGRWYAIDFLLAELKQLRVTERFDPKTGKQVYPNRFPKAVSSFQIATLEEEIQLIQGLNRSRSKDVGIYPELKQPAWHREQGRDISRVVLPILTKYGYATKESPCWLQCFDFDELRRIRTELEWKGRMVYLLGKHPSGGSADSETVMEPDLRNEEGLRAVAEVVHGIGPAIGLIVTGKSPASRAVSDLTRRAQAVGLVVHPYTFRSDELPKTIDSSDDLLRMLFDEAKVDGLFSDFPDSCLDWLEKRKP